MLIPRILKVLGLVGATAYAMLALAGCGATATIKGESKEAGTQAAAIREQAGVVKRSVDAIIPAVEKNDDKALTTAVVDIRNAANSIDTAAERIQNSTAKIDRAAEKVKDKVPLFWFVLGNLGIIAGTIAALVLLWPVAGPAVLALIPILGRFIAWIIGRIPSALTLVPAKEREAAKLDAEALAAHPESPQVLTKIAAARARSATYTAAFQHFKKSSKA